MSTFYAATAVSYSAQMAPWSVMRAIQEWLKDEATPRLARGASASSLIPQNSSSARLTVRPQDRCADAGSTSVRDGRTGPAKVDRIAEDPAASEADGGGDNPTYVFTNMRGKSTGINYIHLSYHDFIRPYEIYDLFH